MIMYTTVNSRVQIQKNEITVVFSD